MFAAKGQTKIVSSVHKNIIVVKMSMVNIFLSFQVVTDLLMSEAVRHYTRGDTRPGETREHRNYRKRKEHTSEDSGVESGHGLENTGKSHGSNES